VALDVSPYGAASASTISNLCASLSRSSKPAAARDRDPAPRVSFLRTSRAAPFHADERDALLAVLEPDFDPVRRVRVDRHAVVFQTRRYGREAVGVGARSRDEPGIRDAPENLRSRQGEDPVASSSVHRDFSLNASRPTRS